jgi:hypothetical protein
MAIKKGANTKAKNPSGGQYSIAGGAKKSTAMVKSNTSVAQKTTSAKRKNTSARRNPSSGLNIFLLSAAGVAVVKAFDVAMRYVAPQAAATITTLGMGGAALGLHIYGTRYFGKWADVAAGALALFAVKRAWDAYLDPLLPAWAGGTSGVPQVVGPVAPLVNNETGEQIGMRYQLSTGDVADVYGDPQGMMAEQFVN